MCPDAEVVISGVGMAATAAAIARLDRERGLSADDVVVLAGIAGAYGDSVAVGEVVEVVSEECVELPERFRSPYKQLQPYTSLRRVRSNTVHTMQSESRGADIENMEGAALYVIAESLRLSATEIRAISNRVGDHRSLWRIDEATQALACELLKINNL